MTEDQYNLTIQPDIGKEKGSPYIAARAFRQADQPPLVSAKVKVHLRGSASETRIAREGRREGGGREEDRKTS